MTEIVVVEHNKGNNPSHVATNKQKIIKGKSSKGGQI